MDGKWHVVERGRRWFASRKLKEKVRILFLGVITLYVLLFFFLYSFLIQKNMLEYALESNRSTMAAIGKNLEVELETTSAMSQLIMRNRDVVEYLKKDASKDPRLAYNATVAVFDISNTFRNVSSIYLFKNNGETLHISRGVTRVDMAVVRDPSWNWEIRQKDGGYVLRVDGDGAFSSPSGEPLVSFLRMVNDIETQQPLGMMAINLSRGLLDGTYSEMEGEGRQFAYMDPSRGWLWDEPVDLGGLSPGDEDFEQTHGGNWWRPWIASCHRVPDTPFVLAGRETVSINRFLSAEAAVSMAAVVLLTFASLGGLGLFLSIHITRPIERLSASMDQVKDGWLRRVSIELPDDEIGHLKDRYNNMLVEINRLIEALLEKEQAMRQAELEILQEQIKPHFLYNTLETIGYLALQGKREEAYEAIETLGAFYRKFLNQGNPEISLREEVAIVRDYLKLQKLRYEEVFEDAYELQEDLLEYKVPKLILQPLVENSLYHGLRPKGEPGIIRISVYAREGMLHICVYDNGVGMDQATREALLGGENSKSFGFKGTLDRIRHFCAREDVVEVDSREGEYSRVDIRMPLERGGTGYVQGHDHR
ncbi:cache domain-containing sensor histidine kinase [Anaerotalea alkaliphila]|uniref:Sensor histidine kinase n=1 Tax=Anaerotalea alkaliphila TaxID=2662126 RepID=A0A7X5HXP1_9FIRM|nr:sensor histidine kinase [Anaerotalea alkaliphila]NDL68578.1 sensor histidine kinase [Anaerotalea alkaliphila]